MPKEKPIRNPVTGLEDTGTLGGNSEKEK